MKFCSKCGNELFDEAVMCPKCGCATEAPVKTVKNNTAPAKNQAIGAILIILGIVIAIAAILSVSAHINGY